MRGSFRKIRFSILVCLIISIEIIPKQIFAGDFSNAEIHFLQAYQARVNGDWAGCADEAFQAAEAAEKENEFAWALASRSRLYLADCQSRLGAKGLAAFHIRQIDEERLSSVDKKIYNHLIRLLNHEIEEQERLWITLYPYYGVLSFSSNASKVSGNFFGTYADFIQEGWKVSVGAEKLGLSFGVATSSYSQILALLGVNKLLKEGGDLHIKTVYIGSDYRLQDTIWVFNGGFSVWPGSLTKLTFDAFLSLYPNSPLGKMSIPQGSITLEQWLYSNPEFEAGFKLGSHTEFPAAVNTSDATTGFTLRSLYERVTLDLQLRVSILRIGGGYWLGSEAFGVRNDGGLVYSDLEEHQSGWNSYVRVSPSPDWFAQVYFMHDYYAVGTTHSSINALYGMLSVTF